MSAEEDNDFIRSVERTWSTYTSPDGVLVSHTIHTVITSTGNDLPGDIDYGDLIYKLAVGPEDPQILRSMDTMTRPRTSERHFGERRLPEVSGHRLITAGSTSQNYNPPNRPRENIVPMEEVDDLPFQSPRLGSSRRHDNEEIRSASVALPAAGSRSGSPIPNDYNAIVPWTRSNHSNRLDDQPLIHRTLSGLVRRPQVHAGGPYEGRSRIGGFSALRAVHRSRRSQRYNLSERYIRSLQFSDHR